jgi:hypothetical protein
MKSGNLNLLETSGLVQACARIALPVSLWAGILPVSFVWNCYMVLTELQSCKSLQGTQKMKVFLTLLRPVICKTRCGDQILSLAHAWSVTADWMLYCNQPIFPWSHMYLPCLIFNRLLCVQPCHDTRPTCDFQMNRNLRGETSVNTRDWYFSV